MQCVASATRTLLHRQKKLSDQLRRALSQYKSHKGYYFKQLQHVGFPPQRLCYKSHANQGIRVVEVSPTLILLISSPSVTHFQRSKTYICKQEVVLIISVSNNQLYDVSLMKLSPIFPSVCFQNEPIHLQSPCSCSLPSPPMFFFSFTTVEWFKN